MKSFALIIALTVALGGWAQTDSSGYATPEAATYAQAARQVLVRVLSESVARREEPLRGVDTIYVGYPGYTVPPREFFQNLPFEKRFFVPLSRRPPYPDDFFVAIHLSRAESPDSVEFRIDWRYEERRLGSSGAVLMTNPPYATARAKLVRKDNVWEIVRWE